MNALHNALQLYYRTSSLPALASPVLDASLRLFPGERVLPIRPDQDPELGQYAVPVPRRIPGAAVATGLRRLSRHRCRTGIPVLLALGLFGRFAALGLSILNAVAAYSYYDQLGEAGLNQHLYWGLLLAALLVHGPGKWSLDAWLEQRCR